MVYIVVVRETNAYVDTFAYDPRMHYIDLEYFRVIPVTPRDRASYYREGLPERES